MAYIAPSSLEKSGRVFLKPQIAQLVADCCFSTGLQPDNFAQIFKIGEHIPCRITKPFQHIPLHLLDPILFVSHFVTMTSTQRPAAYELMSIVLTTRAQLTLMDSYYQQDTDDKHSSQFDFLH